MIKSFLTVLAQATLPVPASCRKAVVFLSLSALALPAAAQIDSLASINRHFEKYRRHAFQEKLFLHLDRPAYVSGETMWFKVYAADGATNKPLAMSKVAYVEVVDADQKPVLQGKVELTEGSGYGSFILPSTVESGHYRVRAYTNWMKNFSPGYYFESPVTIVNTTRSPETRATPDSAGFTLQFFPEGGNLVAGLTSRVAYKVQMKSRAQPMEGEIQDQAGKVLTRFTPDPKGLGTFMFTPVPGQTYRAVIRQPNRPAVSRSLPRIFDSGYVLLLEPTEANQLKITVTARTVQGPVSGQPVHLLAHTRQQNPVALTALLDGGKATFLLPKSALAEGISHLTIFDRLRRPVCERLFFKVPGSNLVLRAETNKKQYAPREKVSLTLADTRTATPEKTDLSVAVYRLDSLATFAQPDIRPYLWLTSDLQGPVADPGSYFQLTGPAADEAFDLLMLTQGWRRFKWEEVFQSGQPAYGFAPELAGHLVRARLTEALTGKPVAGITSFLAAPGRQLRLYTATSNNLGLAQFETQDFYDSRDLVLQTDFRRDSTYHFEILSPYSDKFATAALPAFRLSQDREADLSLRHLQSQVQGVYYARYRNLVRVPRVDSTAFYGKPDEHYRLDDFTRFKVMEEVMREYVPGVLVRIRKDGFHFLVADRVNKTVFESNPLVLLDGVPIFNINKIMAFDPLKVQTLDVVTSRYFHGSQIFDGLVSYTTYTGDLHDFPLDPRALLLEYEGLQLPREFYAPQYDTPEKQQSRLPDQRNLLYWNPKAGSTPGTAKPLEFFTGDQPGFYQIVIQGLSQNGAAGTAVQTFEVKAGL